MGGILNGSTKRTTTEKGYADWQEPYLKGANQAAWDLFNKQKSQGPYTGDLYAGLDDYSKQALAGLVGYAGGTGASLADSVSKNALALAGVGQGYGGALSKYMDAATIDPTQANLAAAGAYASNPYLDAQIDAIGRDITRNFQEVTLPSIDRNATALGGINSTRAGIAEGVAARDAQQQLIDAAAGIRANAYNSGLSLAEQARQANLAALGSATSQYGIATGLQGDLAGRASDLAYGNYDRVNEAGKQLQADKQGQLDADFNKWAMNRDYDWQLLNNLYGIIGNSWGGSSTSTQKSGGNLLGGILGSIMSGAGVYQKFKDLKG